MEIIKLVVGQLQSNCYLAFDENTKEGIIIDPGDSADYLTQKVREFQVKLKFIIVTHGHFDHILGINEMKINFGVPFLVHRNDQFLLERMGKAAQYWLGSGLDFGPPPLADGYIKQNDLVNFGKEELRVIETPGHTPGGISLHSGHEIFTGDCLFKNGIGRTDFSYASEPELKRSLKKILSMPDDFQVFPGHGEETTLGAEKKNLAYLFQT